LGLSHVVSLRLLRHLARDTFFRGKVSLSHTQQPTRINYQFLRHVRIKLHDGGRFGLSAGVTVFSAFRPGT
ncbi:hypothetical protein ACQJ22_27635, partial [Pseudomonas fragariae (ex Marin et al. 2024)]